MKVSFENKEIDISGDCRLSFDEFDKWVRRRFKFSDGDILIYKDKTQSEIIPSATGAVDLGTLYPRIIVTREQIESKPLTSAASSVTSWWPLFILSIPPLLVVITAANLISSNQIGPGIVLNTSQFTVSSLGLSKSWEKNLIEAYVAFITWSTTYLFIRRLWNPESAATALNKFAADSIFGGFAASGAVILKHVINSVVVR